MLIAVVNQSTLVTDDQVRQMVSAVAKQARMHLAPAWDMTPPAVVFYTAAKHVPAQAHGIAVVDTVADEPAGVLGFHTEDQGGKLWGVVAAKPELDAGAKVMAGDWAVSSVLSHEALEMAVDPQCNLWANNDNGRAYSREVCDPVEAPTYTVDGVAVSNFVTPAWFDPLADPRSSFDHLGLLKAPFTLAPGGYLVWASAGREQQENGDRMPGWRLAMKAGPLARTARRRRQAATMATPVSPAKAAE